MAGHDNLLVEAAERCRGPLVAALLFSMVINLLMLTVPLYMLQVFDRVLASRSVDTLVHLTTIGLGALFVMALVDIARARIFVRIGAWLDEVLSGPGLARALEAQLRGAGYRLEVLGDLSALRNALGGAALPALFDSPWIPIFLFALFMLHPALGWLATAGAVLLFILAVINDLATRGRLRAANAQARRLSLQSEAALRNAEVIDAMGLLAGFQQRWLEGRRRVVDMQQGASNRASLLAAFAKAARLALQLLILGLGAYFVVHRELTPGGMIAGSIIMARALAPIEQSIQGWRQLSAARQAFVRLRRFFAEPRYREPGMALPPPEGRLSAENATYAFPRSDKAAVKGVSFALQPGESLALIGPSASGKTTLARLLVGTLRPYSGAVRLDGADIFGWRRDAIGQHVGYLPQDVELFPGTVAENIARFTEATDEAIVDAARRAGCHEMILRLAKGYGTEIGEGGAFLSGGQRQRIALARALLGDPRLVVLDEPNANLDSEGEEALLHTLEDLKMDMVTTVLITHKPSLTESVDKILVLRDGVVEVFGSRDEVLARVRRMALPERQDAAGYPRPVESQGA